jgi:tetratricopeptide (TPR) repeat protein
MKTKRVGDRGRGATEAKARRVTAEPGRFWIAWSADDAKDPAVRFFERGVELLKPDARPDWRDARHEAIAVFDRATELAPNLVGAYALRAVALLDLRENAKAIEACDSALSFEKRLLAEADAVQNRAWLEDKEARSALFEQSRNGFLYIAWLHVLRAEAITAAEDDEFSPPYGKLFVERRHKLGVSKRYNEALRECERAFEVIGRNRSGGFYGADVLNGYRVQAGVLRRIGRLDEAINRYREALTFARYAVLDGNEVITDRELVGIAEELELALVDKEQEELYNSDLMGDAAHDLNALAANLGLTFEEAAAKLTARETTGRATAEPRPDWIEAHKRGVTVPEFIREAFAIELRDRSMHKGLFSRYENLRRDFYAYKRHHKLPDWLKAVPKESDWNDKQVAEGKMNIEAIRSGERERKRVSAAQGRGVVVALS